MTRSDCCTLPLFVCVSEQYSCRPTVWVFDASVIKAMTMFHPSSVTHSSGADPIAPLFTCFTRSMFSMLAPSRWSGSIPPKHSSRRFFLSQGVRTLWNGIPPTLHSNRSVWNAFARTSIVHHKPSKHRNTSLRCMSSRTLVVSRTCSDGGDGVLVRMLVHVSLPFVHAPPRVRFSSSICHVSCHVSCHVRWRCVCPTERGECGGIRWKANDTRKKDQALTFAPPVQSILAQGSCAQSIASENGMGPSSGPLSMRRLAKCARLEKSNSYDRLLESVARKEHGVLLPSHQFLLEHRVVLPTSWCLLIEKGQSL